MSEKNSSSESAVLIMEPNQSESAFKLPSWSKGAYLTSSEEEMITASLPVYDPARFARSGKQLLVLADFPLSYDPQQTQQVVIHMDVTDIWIRRTTLIMMAFLGLAILFICLLSNVRL